jgi:hypothetical protein
MDLAKQVVVDQGADLLLLTWLLDQSGFRNHHRAAESYDLWNQRESGRWC